MKFSNSTHMKGPCGCGAQDRLRRYHVVFSACTALLHDLKGLHACPPHGGISASMARVMHGRGRYAPAAVCSGAAANSICGGVLQQTKLGTRSQRWGESGCLTQSERQMFSGYAVACQAYEPPCMYRQPCPSCTPQTCHCVLEPSMIKIHIPPARGTGLHGWCWCAAVQV